MMRLLIAVRRFGWLALLATFVACGATITRMELPVQVEFRRASFEPQPSFIAMETEEAQRLYVDPTPTITNADIASVRMTTEVDRRILDVRLTPEGAQKLGALSKTNIDQPLALLVDGMLVAAPIIRQELSEEVTVYLSASPKVEQLAQALGTQPPQAAPGAGLPPLGRGTGFTATLWYDLIRISLGLALLASAITWYRDRQSRAKKIVVVALALMLILIQALALMA